METIVVMGVSGCGKSTLGRLLAEDLQIPFIEGDNLHSAQNIQKMSNGIALNDEDRDPWLRQIGSVMRENGGSVVACSALKRSYRDILRQVSGSDLLFVFMDVDICELERRLSVREGHFMAADLLQSQLDILEPPGDGERFIISQPHMDVSHVVELIRKQASE